MCPEGAQVELYRERCVPKVLKLSSEVSECQPLGLGLDIDYRVGKVLGRTPTKQEMAAVGRGLHSSTSQLNRRRS